MTANLNELARVCHASPPAATAGSEAVRILNGVQDVLLRARDEAIGSHRDGIQHAAELVEGLRQAALSTPPSPDARPDKREGREAIEREAKRIYDGFEYDGPPGTTKPAWVPFGNSLKQDEARRLARAALASAAETPRPDVNGEGVAYRIIPKAEGV